MPAQQAANRTDQHSAHYATGCPLCRRPLIRTSRRPLDRLTSVVKPVRRFRCEHFKCQWEGNLPVRRADFVPAQATQAALAAPDADDAPPSPPWSFVVSSSLSLAGIVVLVAIAATDVLVEDKVIAYIHPGDFSLSTAPKVGNTVEP